MAKDLIIRSSTEEFITFKLQEKGKGKCLFLGDSYLVY